MSDLVSAAADRLDRLPTFDLSFAVDDEADPRWVTVYAEADEEIATHWISIEYDVTVSLDDVV